MQPVQQIRALIFLVADPGMIPSIPYGTPSTDEYSLSAHKNNPWALPIVTQKTKKKELQGLEVLGLWHMPCLRSTWFDPQLHMYSSKLLGASPMHLPGGPGDPHTALNITLKPEQHHTLNASVKHPLLAENHWERPNRASWVPPLDLPEPLQKGNKKTVFKLVVPFFFCAENSVWLPLLYYILNFIIISFPNVFFPVG